MPSTCAGSGLRCERRFTRSSTSSADRMATTEAPKKIWSDMSWIGIAVTTPTLDSSQYTPGSSPICLQRRSTSKHTCKRALWPEWPP